MHAPATRSRVRLVIVDAGRVALIRRQRAGHTYYVLPGGGVEPGETVEQAARREAREELGVEVALGDLLAEESLRGQRFFYHRATIVGGEFGTGAWPDIESLPADARAAHGTYEAFWRPVDDLDGLDVDAPLAALLEERPIVRMDRLDHLVLTVADIDRTREFYSRVLGLLPARSADGRVSVHVGDQKINLHQRGREFEPKAARPTPGSADLCFVTSVPLATIVDHLARQGVDVELGPVRRTGALGPMTSVYLRDPDGNLVEVASYDVAGS